MTEQDTMAKEIAEHIAKIAPGAVVNMNPPPAPAVPQEIANNLLAFMQRVQCTGVEAIAWAEAFHFLRQFVPAQPGVPFQGLPEKK